MKTKTKNIAKRLVVIGAAMILALLFCMSLALSASADAATPTVKIDRVSLAIEDRICLLFRVTVTGLDEYLAEHLEYDEDEWELKLQVGTTPVSNNWSYTTLTSYRTESNHEFFSYNGQTAKQMTESVYARAELYLGGDEEEYLYSDVVRYSVLDYAYYMKNSTKVFYEDGTTLGELVQQILEYGATAQLYFGYHTDRLPTDEYYLVLTENGSFSDGMTSAIVFPGDSVTLTADEIPAGAVFDGWKDENGLLISIDSTLTVSPTSEKTYHPVFCSGGLAFESINSTTCALVGMGTCTDTDLVIPNRAPDGKRVTKITDDALVGHSSITSVRIPASVTTIEHGAFDGCTSLESITVEEGNTSFTDESFVFVYVDGGTVSGGGLSNKILLLGESLDITAVSPGGLEFDHWEDENGNSISDDETTTVSPTASMTYRAVFGIPAMEENVSLGLVYETIDENSCALIGLGTCTDTDLVIPNRAPSGKLVTRINADALAGNTSLTSIRIPATLTTIGTGAFDGCTSLAAFSVQEGNTTFSAYYEMLMNYDQSVVLKYPPARTVTSLSLPDSTRSVADRALQGASNLTAIYLNAALETIGDYAFAGTSISSIKIKAAVTSIGAYAFDHCSKLTGNSAFAVESENTHYKNNSYGLYTYDGKTMLRARNYSIFTSFLSGVTTIAPGAFSGCDKMTRVTIPNTVTTIGEYAFADCTLLRTVTVGSAVTRIETRAFYGCSNSSFTAITIPANVTYIGDFAFENCTHLASVTLNGTLSYRGEEIFRGTAIDENHTHSFTQKVTLSSATCQQGAVYTYACSCGERSGERFVSQSAGAHSYSNGSCTACGQIKANTSYDSYLILPIGAEGDYYGSFDPSDSSYSSIDNCNILYFTGVSSGSYSAYVQRLSDAGLTKEKEYTLGSNAYALFRHSTYTLYVSYLDAQGAMRVYVGMPNDLVPSNTTVAKANVATPSLWQININNKAAGYNGGMSYIIQLSDGKFIVVDGGYETSEDAASIYNILTTYKPASHAKPIVAGWFFTHMHIDHYGAYRAFSSNSTYRNGVVVEAFYYNFLYTNVSDLWPTNNEKFENNMATNWPSATRYRKLHSGMNFTFAGAEVKILCTFEDVYPLSHNSGNDTSTVFQVIMEGQKILFLGDAEFGQSDTMYQLGASVMKSDILQYAHHGYENQCRANLYALIEPSTVLWPMPLVNYQSSSYGECFRPRYQTHSENAWVRSASCVKKIIVMEEGTTRLVLPYTPTGSRNANYYTLYKNIKKTLS